MEGRKSGQNQEGGLLGDLKRAVSGVRRLIPEVVWIPENFTPTPPTSPDRQQNQARATGNERAWEPDPGHVIEFAGGHVAAVSNRRAGSSRENSFTNATQKRVGTREGTLAVADAAKHWTVAVEMDDGRTEYAVFLLIDPVSGHKKPELSAELAATINTIFSEHISKQMPRLLQAARNGSRLLYEEIEGLISESCIIACARFRSPTGTYDRSVTICAGVFDPTARKMRTWHVGDAFQLVSPYSTVQTTASDSRFGSIENERPTPFQVGPNLTWDRHVYQSSYEVRADNPWFMIGTDVIDKALRGLNAEQRDNLFREVAAGNFDAVAEILRNFDDVGALAYQFAQHGARVAGFDAARGERNDKATQWRALEKREVIPDLQVLLASNSIGEMIAYLDTFFKVGKEDVTLLTNSHGEPLSVGYVRTILWDVQDQIRYGDFGKARELTTSLTRQIKFRVRELVGLQ